MAGSEENPWGFYSQYQGLADDRTVALGRELGFSTLILRPGGLDRGEDLRSKRPWEVERHEKNGYYGGLECC